MRIDQRVLLSEMQVVEFSPLPVVGSSVCVPVCVCVCVCVGVCVCCVYVTLVNHTKTA